MTNRHDDDVAVIASMPIGFRSNLIGIAMAKRWLLRPDLSIADRMHHLEFVRSQADSLTKAAVNAIEPANDKFEEIFTAAMRVDNGDTQAATAFGILEKDEPFLNLTKLNPSIFQAIKLCRRHAENLLEWT